MNFFEQGVPLGRWFGISVVIHWTFLIYALIQLSQGGNVGLNALFLAILFAIVLLHEFGHALACKAVGGIAKHIVLWPLGGIAFVQPPPRPWPSLITTACGPLVNAILWPTFWAINTYVLPRMLTGEINPATDVLVTSCYTMEYLNKMLLLFNLIPAYPMDGGRLLQEVLWLLIGYRQSMTIAGMVGTVAGASLIVLGLGLASIHVPVIDFHIGEKGKQNVMLAVIGLLCAMQSFAIYRRSQETTDPRQNG